MTRFIQTPTLTDRQTRTYQAALDRLPNDELRHSFLLRVASMVRMNGVGRISISDKLLANIISTTLADLGISS
jgi:hypothetical protein